MRIASYIKQSEILSQSFPKFFSQRATEELSDFKFSRLRRKYTEYMRTGAAIINLDLIIASMASQRRKAQLKIYYTFSQWYPAKILQAIAHWPDEKNSSSAYLAVYKFPCSSNA